MLFLKYLDDLECARSMEGELLGKSHDFIIEADFRWSARAAAKRADGRFGHDAALTGDALALGDGLSFRSQKETPELPHLHEAKIRNMGNAGRNGGEYYTPRPLIRAMIRVTKPEIDERIYDGAAGSAGFLREAHRSPRHGADGKGASFPRRTWKRSRIGLSAARRRRACPA
jgi:type I restriction enzyme M protein